MPKEKGPPIEDQVYMRYLLKDLTEEERDGLEELYFVDEMVFNKLRIAEDNLIRNYVNNSLTADDRLKFEKNYLTTPERREQVELVRELGRSEMWIPPAQTSFWQKLRQARMSLFHFPFFGPAKAVYATLLCIAIATGAALLYLQSNIGNKSPEMLAFHLSLDTSRGAVGTEDSNTDSNPGPSDDNQKTLYLNQKTEKVALQVEVGTGPDQTYEGILLKDDQIVWKSGAPQKVAGGVVSFTVPAGSLTDGVYLLRINDVDADRQVRKFGVTYFQVQRK